MLELLEMEEERELGKVLEQEPSPISIGQAAGKIAEAALDQVKEKGPGRIAEIKARVSEILGQPSDVDDYIGRIKEKLDSLPKDPYQLRDLYLKEQIKRKGGFDPDQPGNNLKKAGFVFWEVMSRLAGNPSTLKIAEEQASQDFFKFYAPQLMAYEKLLYELEKIKQQQGMKRQEMAVRIHDALTKAQIAEDKLEHMIRATTKNEEKAEYQRRLSELRAKAQMATQALNAALKAGSTIQIVTAVDSEGNPVVIPVEKRPDETTTKAVLEYLNQLGKIYDQVEALAASENQKKGEVTSFTTGIRRKIALDKAEEQIKTDPRIKPIAEQIEQHGWMNKDMIYSAIIRFVGNYNPLPGGLLPPFGIHPSHYEKEEDPNQAELRLLREAVKTQDPVEFLHQLSLPVEADGMIAEVTSQAAEKALQGTGVDQDLAKKAAESIGRNAAEASQRISGDKNPIRALENSIRRNLGTGTVHSSERIRVGTPTVTRGSFKTPEAATGWRQREQSTALTDMQLHNTLVRYVNGDLDSFLGLPYVLRNIRRFSPFPNDPEKIRALTGMSKAAFEAAERILTGVFGLSKEKARNVLMKPGIEESIITKLHIELFQAIIYSRTGKQLNQVEQKQIEAILADPAQDARTYLKQIVAMGFISKALNSIHLMAGDQADDEQLARPFNAFIDPIRNSFGGSLVSAAMSMADTVLMAADHLSKIPDPKQRILELRKLEPLIGKVTDVPFWMRAAREGKMYEELEKFRQEVASALPPIETPAAPAQPQAEKKGPGLLEGVLGPLGLAGSGFYAGSAPFQRGQDPRLGMIGGTIGSILSMLAARKPEEYLAHTAGNLAVGKTTERLAGRFPTPGLITSILPAAAGAGTVESFLPGGESPFVAAAKGAGLGAGMHGLLGLMSRFMRTPAVRAYELAEEMSRFGTRNPPTERAVTTMAALMRFMSEPAVKGEIREGLTEFTRNLSRQAGLTSREADAIADKLERYIREVASDQVKILKAGWPTDILGARGPAAALDDVADKIFATFQGKEQAAASNAIRFLQDYSEHLSRAGLNLNADELNLTVRSLVLSKLLSSMQQGKAGGIPAKELPGIKNVSDEIWTFLTNGDRKAAEDLKKGLLSLMRMEEIYSKTPFRVVFTPVGLVIAVGFTGKALGSPETMIPVLGTGVALTLIGLPRVLNSLAKRYDPAARFLSAASKLSPGLAAITATKLVASEIMRGNGTIIDVERSAVEDQLLQAIEKHRAKNNAR